MHCEVGQVEVEPGANSFELRATQQASLVAAAG